MTSEPIPNPWRSLAAPAAPTLRLASMARRGQRWTQPSVSSGQAGTDSQNRENFVKNGVFFYVLRVGLACCTMARGTFKHYKPNGVIYALFPWAILVRVFRPERLAAFSVVLLILVTAIFGLNGWQFHLREPDSFFLLSIAGFFTAYACFSPMASHTTRERWTFKTVSFDYAVPPLTPVGAAGGLTGLFGLTQAVLILAGSTVSLASRPAILTATGLLVVLHFTSMVFLVFKRRAKHSHEHSRQRHRSHRVESEVTEAVQPEETSSGEAPESGQDWDTGSEDASADIPAEDLDPAETGTGSERLNS